ncbi:MAG TPA: rod shape-determining protein MreC [bacterium]|nr:rod shape-determining protein MreC [bacterium]
MLKFLLRNLSALFLVALFLACGALLLYRSSHRGAPPPTFKTTALSLWLPVQQTVTRIITFPEDTLNAIRELKNLHQEVDRLQLENQSLRIELSNHKSTEEELARLQRMEEIKPTLSRKAHLARIIAHDPSVWNSSFIVDAGSDAGIQVDSPVISEQGLVGRVIEVSSGNSRVLLASDPDFSVAGIDDRSRVSGVVQGTGRNQLRYGYVSAAEDVQKDDVILSSGLGGVFPKGYRLGTVIRKGEAENGLMADILLAPAVDFASLDYVFILPPAILFQ